VNMDGEAMGLAVHLLPVLKLRLALDGQSRVHGLRALKRRLLTAARPVRHRYSVV
jgi:hypothetical protein